MTKRKDGIYQQSVVINEKRRYFYGKTKSEVLEKIRNYKEKEETGLLFLEVIEEWKEKHYKEIEASTARGYEASRKRAVIAFGNKPIKEITSQNIQLFINNLVASNYGKKVIHTQLNVLNMVFNYAIFNGYTSTNPCFSTKLPNNLKSEKRELPSEKDLEKVRSSEWLFPYFLLYTGCRRGEALAIKYEDIDFKNKIIHINKAVGYRDNIPYLKTTKTVAGQREIILLDCLAERIPKNKKGFIFANEDNTLYHNHKIRSLWKNWQIKNDTTVTPHQLRHGFATILFDAEIDEKDAQDLLGHTTIAMTRDIYTHISKSRKQKTAVKLNEYVKMM